MTTGAGAGGFLECPDCDHPFVYRRSARYCPNCRVQIVIKGQWFDRSIRTWVVEDGRYSLLPMKR